MSTEKIVTRRAESWSLLWSVASSQAFSQDSLQEEEESRPPAVWFSVGRRGLWGWWSRAREDCQMLQKLMTKRGNGRYRTSSIDTDWVGARLNCSSCRLDYGHHVVTPVKLLPQCGEATAIYGEKVALVQRSKGCGQGLRMFLHKGEFQL